MGSHSITDSHISTITDTIPGTNFYGSRISFCTWPNLSLDGVETVNINIVKT